MVLELARIEVRPGSGPDFERVVEQARPFFARAKGFKSLELRPSLDDPDTYWLLVRWETLENHIHDFRGSPEHAAWRALAGPFFAAPPLVDHVETDAL